MFDIADSALFALAKGPMLTEMLGSEPAYKANGPALEGTIQMIFLLGWSLGGLIFGIAADRWGRTKTLIVTILLYCLFTGLTALCHTPEQVMVLRFLTGLGIGGEWAAGAALVAEAFPDRSRAPAASVLQSAAALGPALAALANLGLAHQGWRVLFMIGVLPAIMTVFIRFKVGHEEPEAVKTEEPEKFPLTELFQTPILRRNAFVALAMGFAGIAGAGTVTFWLPNLVKAASVGMDAAGIAQRQSYATFSMHAGTLLGVILFPWLCEKFGRRPSFALFFALSPISIWIAAQVAGDHSYTSLLLAAPIMSFFSIGLSSGFGLYFPELFPKRVRATGAGFAYNMGRILTAPVPKWTGDFIKAQGGNVGAGVIAAGCVFLIGLVALPFAKETKGEALER